MILLYLPNDREKVLLGEVEADNQDAIQLYEKVDYAVARELEEIAASNEIFKFLKMSKLLAPVPRNDAAT